VRVVIENGAGNKHMQTQDERPSKRNRICLGIDVIDKKRHLRHSFLNFIGLVVVDEYLQTTLQTQD
jgi:hypothetical protein